MNNRLKITLLVLFCVPLIMAGVARAEMASTNYLLAPHVISAGGHISLEAGGKLMNDIKGQGIAGEMSSANYGLGLGGIYGTGPTIVEGDWPYGTVPLYISRSGDNLKISWEARFVNPQIFISTGNGAGEYVNDGPGWLSLDDPALSDDIDKYLSQSYFIHINQVGQSFPEAYYKALQAGVNRSATNPRVMGASYLGSAWAVGKVNVNISRAGANGWNFIAYPFNVRPIGEALFGNFSAADEIKIRDEATKQFAPVSVAYSAASGQWGTQPFERAKGYWLYRSQTAPLTATMIGSVTLDNYSTSLTRVGANGWNFVGLPYPRWQALSAFGPAAANALDEFKVRNEDSKLIEASYPKSTWGTQQIRTAKGYLYYRAVPDTLPWEIAY